MKMRIYLSVVLFMSIASVAAKPSPACTCAPPLPGSRTALERAEAAAAGADVIFQGRVKAAKLVWTILDAHSGDVLPADLDDDPPTLRVSLDVERAYRGLSKSTVELSTGLGSGDCGFGFEVGREYLVYAYYDDSGQFSTSICTATAPLEDSAVNLAYLHGEFVPETDAKDEISSPGVKICGRTVGSDPDGFANAKVFLFPKDGASPIPSDEADAGKDGSFCFKGISPGQYRLLFVNESRDEGTVTSFAFFPGVLAKAEATTITVASEEPKSGVVIRVPRQTTYTVSGRILNFSSPQLKANSKIVLLNAKSDLFMINYQQDVRPDGTFVFPQVLPGSYRAFATADSDERGTWYTRLVDLEVEANTTGVLVDLFKN